MDIVKIVSGLTVMLWSNKNIFVHKENKNNDFIQQFLLVCVTQFPFKGTLLRQSLDAYGEHFAW